MRKHRTRKGPPPQKNVKRQEAHKARMAEVQAQREAAARREHAERAIEVKSFEVLEDANNKS